MKKVFLALSFMLGVAAFATAQTAAKATKPALTTATNARVVPMDKKVTPAATAKVSTSATTQPASATAKTKLKADGTADMRYKENKAAAAPVAGPKKADGTADKRFKANKTAAKS